MPLKALHPHHTKQLPETAIGSGLLFIYIDLVVVGLLFATFRKGFAGVFATVRHILMDMSIKDAGF